MNTLERMQDTLPEFVLVVNVENNTRTVNYNDRRTAVLWGDGSAAAVVSGKVASEIAIHTMDTQSDPSLWKHIRIRSGGHFEQDGTAVQAFAIRTMSTVLNSLRIQGVFDHEYFVGHQANLRVLESVCRRT